MLNHRQVEIFRALMTAGGVTAAAGALHTSQPTLSRELARIEQVLGYALFERLGGRLRPTQRALALFDEVQRAYQGLERVNARAQELARDDAGSLELLCLPALSHALLPATCARLQRAHPDARLNITPQEPPLLDEWLQSQRFDLGLTEQGLPAAGLELQRLMSADEVCVLPASHALTDRTALEPGDFADQSFLSLASTDPYRQKLDALFAERGVQRQLRMQTHSAAALCEMVRAGLGVAIVNPLTALACAGPGLVLRRFAVSVPYEVWLARPQLRARHWLTEAMQQCLTDEARALEQRLGSALA
jgi:DNA-binding transcriptional LysR family regulator